MGDETRLRLSLGDFNCEINGFDDPLPILGRIVGIFGRLAAEHPDLFPAPPRDMTRERRIAEQLAARLAPLDLAVNLENRRVSVSPRPASQAGTGGRQASSHGLDPALLAEFERMRRKLRAEGGSPRPRVRVVKGSGKPAETRAEPAPPPGNQTVGHPEPSARAAALSTSDDELFHFSAFAAPQGEAMEDGEVIVLDEAMRVRPAPPPRADDSLPALRMRLETAALHLALERDPPCFSQDELMSALVATGGAEGIRPETRRRAFRHLVREGSLRQRDDGRYMLSLAALRAHAARLAAARRPDHASGSGLPTPRNTNLNGNAQSTPSTT